MTDSTVCSAYIGSSLSSSRIAPRMAWARGPFCIGLQRAPPAAGRGQSGCGRDLPYAGEGGQSFAEAQQKGLSLGRVHVPRLRQGNTIAQNIVAAETEVEVRHIQQAS